METTVHKMMGNGEFFVLFYNVQPIFIFAYKQTTRQIETKPIRDEGHHSLAITASKTAAVCAPRHPQAPTALSSHSLPLASALRLARSI